MAITSKKKILLVEDHDDTRTVTAIILRNHGYEVTTARTKKEALDHCADGQFDLLIGDLGLPDGDGLDLMRQIAVTCKIKAIAYTGYGYESDIAASRAAGYAVHLTKPTDSRVLCEAVERLLAET
jgi:CheY-like chemotaxis protein